MTNYTSVKCLVKKIMVWENDHEKWIEIPTRELEDILKQVTDMHKQEIKEAFEMGVKHGLVSHGREELVNPNWHIDYYNDKFKNDKE